MEIQTHYGVILKPVSVEYRIVEGLEETKKRLKDALA